MEYGLADIPRWDAEAHIRPAPVPIGRDRMSGMERATAQGWGAEERNYRILTDTSPAPPQEMLEARKGGKGTTGKPLPRMPDRLPHIGAPVKFGWRCMALREEREFCMAVNFADRSTCY